MAQNFPNSPTNGDTTVINGITYTYVSASSKWRATQVGGSGAGSGGAGVTTYADTATMVTAAPDAGSLGYVTANENLYIYNGSGWSKVDTTNLSPVINSVQDASANTTPFNLATDGTPTVITVSATDPEGFPLTYTYGVTSGSLGTTATVTQGTAPNTNEFTITPGTNDPADAGTFELTFTVDDGVTTAATSVADFTLSFVTAGLFGDRAVLWREGGAGSAGIEYTSITTGANTASFGNSRPDGTDGIATTDAIYSVHTATYNYTTSSYILDVDYVTIGTLGNASLLGNLSTVHRGGQGTNDDTYCVWAQGYNETNANGEIRETTQIDYMTTQTGGNAGDFGNVSWHASSVIEAITDGTRAILGGGYKTGGAWTSDLEYVTIQTPGNAASWGNRTYSGGEAGGTSDGATRGLWFGGYGPPSNNNYNYIDYVTLGGNTNGGASSFGTLTGSLFNPGTATSDGTYAIAVSNNGGNYVDVVTIATAGNATNFGGVTLFSNTYTASSGT